MTLYEYLDDVATRAMILHNAAARYKTTMIARDIAEKHNCKGNMHDIMVKQRFNEFQQAKIALGKST